MSDRSFNFQGYYVSENEFWRLASITDLNELIKELEELKDE